MIPKIIHYVWVGGKPLGKLQQQCIASWRQYLPSYELKLWDENTLPREVLEHPYVQTMYQKGKWAFVSDYIRFWALSREGGIYLDTDTEVLKSFDPLLSHPAFFGRTKDGFVAAGVIGAAPDHQVIKDILKVYDDDTIFDTNRTSPRTVTGVLKKDSYPDVVVYDYQYFNPCDDGERCTPEKLALAYTDNHWAESWVPFARLRKIARRSGVKALFRRWRQSFDHMFGQRIKSFAVKYAPRRLYLLLYRLYKYWQVFILRRDTSLELTKFNQPQFKELVYNGVRFSLLLDPHNGSLDKEVFIKGPWEKEILDVIQQYVSDGSVCVDVGANIGSLTLFMAAIAKTGEVHAFEPLPKLCQQLAESIKKNEYTNVTIHNYGLSDRNYEASIQVDLLNIGKTSLDQRNQGGFQEQVQVKRFDDIWNLDTRVDFVKIDVEGHEYQVLKGMNDMLTRDHPVIVFEYSPVFYVNNGTDSLSFLNFIFDLGYHITDINQQPNRTYVSPQDVMENCNFQTDLLCTPR